MTLVYLISVTDDYVADADPTTLPGACSPVMLDFISGFC